MTGLGLLSLVRSATGSSTSAGVVVGVFAVAEAVSAPQVGRLVDRYGQVRALLGLAAAHGLAIAGVLVAVHQHAPLQVLCLPAAAAGLSLPPLSACSATRWARLPADEARLSTALALETTVNDVAFLVGPAAVVALSAGWSPTGATTVAAVLVVSGAVGLASARQTDPGPASTVPDETSRRLWTLPFLAVVVVNVGLGLFFGSMQLSTTAAVAAAERTEWGGALYALLSAASLVGGLAFGARRWTWRPTRMLLVLTGCFTLATALLLLPTSLAGLAGAVTLAGFVVAPLMVVSATLLVRAVPPAVITRAFTWTGSASAAGVAAAAAASGYLVDRAGPEAGFGVAVAAALTCAVGAVLAAVADAGALR